MTDEQFITKLRHYLSKFSEGERPIVPLKKRPDGSIDRLATLDMAVYEGFKPDFDVTEGEQK